MEEFIQCDICYDCDKLLLELPCCNNSKKICQSCLNSLLVKTCPYCRSELDNDIFTNKNVSRSLPSRLSWEEYLHEETNGHLYNINVRELNASRILRRQIHRVRRRYLTEYNINNITRLTKQERRENKKRHRKILKNYTRNIQNNYNNDDNIFHMEL